MTVLTRPAFCSVPDHDSTAGGEAADLAESAGIVLDPEQRLVLDAMLAERGGKWAAFEACVIQGRQNGKTAALEVAALHDVFLRDVGRVVWTAHRFKTTSDSFADLVAACENYDHLRRRVKAVRYAAGEQSIQLVTGSRIDFLARTGGGGRGLTGDVVVVDEALYAQPVMMGALLPTLSARPDPQVRYGSSAGLLESSVLRAIRDRGRRGDDPSLAYVEWASERGCASDGCRHELGSDGCALDDEDRWRAANPAIGRRITMDYVRNERRALPPAEFGRERLGWWEDPAESGADIDPQAWASCSDPAAAPGDPVAIAVDVSPAFRSAAVVACGSGADGRPVLEVVEHAAGTAWVVERLRALQQSQHCGPVGLDPAGPASALLPDLAAAAVAVDAVQSGRVSQAAGGLVAAVLAREVVHRNEPSLAVAVGAARRRQSGDAWKWSRKDSESDISPLVAATLARQLWAERGDPEPGVWML